MRDVLPAATRRSAIPIAIRCSSTLRARSVPVVEDPYPFDETCAVLVEDLDGMALELIEAGS